MTELAWPDGFERTPPEDRRAYPHGFRVSRRSAFENILKQLDHFDALEVEVETAVTHLQDRPNIPYSEPEPRDPGVVVTFLRDGKRHAVPCDRWDNMRDNAQAIAKYIDAKRALDRYGVETVTSEWEAQALPSGDAVAGPVPAHEVLGVGPDADDADVIAAYRERVKEVHPDRGGDSEQFACVKQAKEELLDGGA